MRSSYLRRGLIYLIVIGALVAIFFTIYSSFSAGTEKVSESTLITMVDDGVIAKLEVRGEKVTAYAIEEGKTLIGYNTLDGEVVEGDKVKSTIDGDVGIYATFDAYGVAPDTWKQVDIEHISGGFNWGSLLSFLPLVFFGLLLWFLFRQARGSSNQALGFGRSRARLFSSINPTVTFDDVALTLDQSVCLGVIYVMSLSLRLCDHGVLVCSVLITVSNMR